MTKAAPRCPSLRLGLMASVLTLAVAGGSALAPHASAMSAILADLQSPIFPGRPFRARIIPAASSAVPTTENDMGTDDDGCVHSSALNVYDFYVVIDPYSYFAALSVEWNDRNGQFAAEDLSPKFKEWVLKEFNGELKVDLNQAIESAHRAAAVAGRPPIDRAKFVLDQAQIPPEKRFGNAVRCYEQRGARASVVAKVALMGAWCLRSRMQLPFVDPRLAGGTNEVNDRINRKISKEGEKFSVAKWTQVYSDVFNKDRLTNEGYLVAGLAYHGFLVRAGETRLAFEVLERMKARFTDDDANQLAILMNGLVRSRRSMVEAHNRFLEIAASNFARAIVAEEFPRQRLPETVLVVAESMRRVGKDMEAMDWYLTLAQMPETQPALRDSIHQAGRAPKPDDAFHVQIGWIADQHIEAYKKAGLAHPGTGPVGGNRKVLNAILFENLGTAAYKSPVWQPSVTGSPRDARMMVDLVGKHVLEFQARFGLWPTTLDEMWEKGTVRDRNRLNRFHCPATGKRLLYTTLTGAVAPKTILVADSEPVETEQGKRYFAFLADNTLESSVNPLRPGEVFHLR